MKLTDSVATLPGVGPKRLAALATLGIDTIESLLTYYPFRYEDLSVKPLNELTDQEQVTLKGIVAAPPTLTHFGRRKSRLNFRLLIGQDIVPVTFFNQPWLQKSVAADAPLMVYGRFDAKRMALNGMKIIGTNPDDPMAPIYPANANIRQTTIRQLIVAAWEQYQTAIEAIIPPAIVAHYHLMDRRQMIHDMHFPADSDAASQARRSAKFEEFFLFQIRLQALKHRDQTQQGIAINYDNEQLKRLISTLPYELTGAQKRVVNEICLDLKRPIHMNRLLQGDVGSGKTVVAALVMYAAITGGFQAALMAPTEILAEQHANNLQAIFDGFPVNIALLTGSTKAAARREILPRIENGEINLIVGTHALIQDTVNYHQLGLVVIDEQHRFGVGQRQALREKGMNADVLAMTATPIPRTLAITSYGEMDVSVIDELPAGRKPVTTRWIKDAQIDSAVQFVKAQLAAGHQAYVVTPLIEESEAVDMRNAQAIYERFSTLFSPTYQVGLLHGRMRNDEKEAVMTAFKAKDFQVLVATTVIEVGVDVKDATVMMIYDADHFGLAQLHQLRGRVGRSDQQAYCILIADPKNEYGVQRMEVMTRTNDGFVLSQKDLELRGAGDVLGKKQSGVPDFKVGDPVADLTMLSVAQQEAKKLTDDADWQTQPTNQVLVHYLNAQSDHEYMFD
ncbi:ATP-dependent DNA helicase RecG [Secundilactobacillus kimchicus]|uniref:ATP-dependent DNA helicase RecG n=1 Tax=Secundilactobacillus kimchicus TaxID=528209 RepID=UPI0024A9BC71|nr:ATP-dependent DNA helicase RecG [Secundilactobacillus kimchicus]